MNERLCGLLASGWRGQVKHLRSGRVYVVLGTAYRVIDSDRLWVDVVYHPEGSPQALYSQNLKRFCNLVDGAPRFEAIYEPEAV